MGRMVCRNKKAVDRGRIFLSRPVLGSPLTTPYFRDTPTLLGWVSLHLGGGWKGDGDARRPGLGGREPSGAGLQPSADWGVAGLAHAAPAQDEPSPHLASAISAVPILPLSQPWPSHVDGGLQPCMHFNQRQSRSCLLPPLPSTLFYPHHTTSCFPPFVIPSFSPFPLSVSRHSLRSNTHLLWREPRGRSVVIRKKEAASRPNEPIPLFPAASWPPIHSTPIHSTGI